jgi:hypothetical protein
MQPNDLPRTAADPYPETNYRTHFYCGPTELYNCVHHAGDLNVLTAARATTDSLQFSYVVTGCVVVWALTFIARHLNAIKSTAGRSFLGIKHLPALQQM